MSGGGNQCFASCPASTVTIQPPPFVLTIPGPALYCPNQPMAIEQHNPCAGSGYGMGGPALYASNSGTSNVSSFYSRALPSSSFSTNSFRY
ncbi:scale keratin-like [Sphaerodactylus townsendi]|uniref:scale keratin-like n=1 Tax=Sphaerodactylus townsendi TaxID=933632 RepID=UPI0020272679|nr:scale keratin-like [Sphaerodactylus townsendi]